MAKKPKVEAPKDFQVSPEIVALAKMKGWPDPHEQVDTFIDWHKSHGNMFSDWEAAFRNWMRKSEGVNRVYTQDKPLVRSFADRRAMPVNSIPVAELFTDTPKPSEDERARVSEMLSKLTRKMSVGGKR